MSNKEESKLQYIKGLIEGARLMVSKVESESGLVETDSLLDKILKIIEE